MDNEYKLKKGEEAMGLCYRAKTEEPPNHTFRISKEYKEKLRALNKMGILVGKTIEPHLYRWIDEALEAAKNKK